MKGFVVTFTDNPILLQSVVYPVQMRHISQVLSLQESPCEIPHDITNLT